jgi:OMF family outer membrane factor
VLLVAINVLVVNASLAQQWSLEQCLDTAQVRNKNIQIAKNDLSLSAQREKEAKANLLPKLTVNADYKYFINLPYQLLPLSTFNPAAPEGQFNEAQFGVPHNINANLQLAIPLYNPVAYGGIEVSKIASELSELQYERKEEQVYFEVANLYYNAQILQAQKAFFERNLANADRLLGNLQLLRQQLLVTGTDVGKVELQITQLTTQINAVDSKIEQVLSALKFAIGISARESFRIDPVIESPSVAEYSLQTSLEVRITQTQNRLLNSELRTLNSSRYFPAINFIGSYGTTGFGYDKKPNDFLNFYPLGFAGMQISYPLFNGTVTLRKIDQKQIELRNNELASSLLQDQNAMQVANAELQRRTAYQAIATTEQQIKLAQTIYDNTILQQKQGVATLTEILLADNALREAQQANLNSIIEYLKADLELKKLTGNISN